MTIEQISDEEEVEP
jgi:hypothetical protein